MAKFNSRVSTFLLGDDTNETYEVRANDGGDGGAFVDEGTAAQNDTTDDMTLLPSTPAQEDAYYWGSVVPFAGILLEIYTQGDGSWTITWEYWDGDSWEALTVSDESVGFTAAAGKVLINWTVPSDWATKAVDSTTRYWVRARVSAYTSVITQPKGTQSWLLRAMSEFITEISGLPGERELLDTTTVGDSGREKDPSLENGIIRLAGFFDDQATRGPDAVLGFLRTHTSTVYFTYGPAGRTTGKVAYEGYCWLRRYEITTRVGEMVGWTAEIEVNGVITKTTYT